MKSLVYLGLFGLSFTGVAASCVVAYQVGFAHGLERGQHPGDPSWGPLTPMPSLDQLHVVEQDLNPPSGAATEAGCVSQPIRQPVIAQAFEKPLTESTRSSASAIWRIDGALSPLK